MKRIFLTGVNGLLGTNLSRLLLDSGYYYIIGLVRNKRNYTGGDSPNLKLIEGDLSGDYTEVLKNVDCVVHSAAITSQNLLDYNDYYKVNCNATIQLFHAAAQCNVKKFIFVSTANTLGHGTKENPGTEKDAARKPFRHSLYARSKAAAEAYLLNHKHMMDTIVVNPTFMLGAFDTKPGSGKIILRGLKKKFILYPPGGKNFVHVADVAQGIMNCIEKGRNGEKYLLANENLSYKAFYRKLNAIAHQNPVMIKVPRILLLLAGCFGELIRLLRIPTDLSLVNMRILCTTNYYSNAKSVSELGLKYQPVDRAVSDALNYFDMVQKQASPLSTAPRPEKSEKDNLVPEKEYNM